MTGQAASWQHAAALATQRRDWPELQHIGKRWTTALPASAEGWQTLSRACFEQLLFTQALSAFEKVLQLEPFNPAHSVSAARIATAARQYDYARTMLENALGKNPESAEVLYALARVCHLTGDLARAEQLCSLSIRIQPGYPPAYTTLGLLREGKLDDSHLTTVCNMLEHPQLPAEYRAMLGFTLGDALDRKGEYAAAFAAWAAANTINYQMAAQEGFRYQAAQQEAEFRLLTGMGDSGIGDGEVLTALSADSGNSLPVPIFVIGMPRSGTTLVESILASHSLVYGAGELPALCEIYDELMAVAKQSGVEAARAALVHNAAAWRQRYIDALPDCGGARYVVDKQPLNFRAVEIIRVLFPHSAVIYTQRSELDITLSIFRNNFNKNWPCAHRLADIQHYLAEHKRVMGVWQQRYPTGIHVVDHEALVRNPPQEIRQLLSAVGLRHEPACLTPHHTQRPIATFSAVQVRQPVSAAYSGRSVHYLPWLG